MTASMSSKIQLSIIIPTLNEENWLPCLMESVSKQTFCDYEVIVSDAESTDRTRDIAGKAGSKIVVAPRSGPGSGKNIGARSTSGEILLFLDADVILPNKDFLKKAVEEFTSRDLAVAGCYLRPTDQRLLYRILFSLNNLANRTTQAIDPHAACIIFAKRAYHEKIGGFDESPVFREDHDYVKRMSKLGKFGILTSVFVLVSTRRFEQDGIFRTMRIWLLSEMLRVFGKQKYSKFNYKFGHYTKKRTS